MSSIMERIKARGAVVKRDRWRLKIVKRGTLSASDIQWISDHRADLMREIWPLYDDWEERAAIREYCGEQDRETANNAAYSEVVARV